MPEPTTQPVTQRIAHAIARRSLDQQWRVEITSPPPDVTPRDDRDAFLDATVTGDTGRDLIRFSIARERRGHRLLETNFFAGTIDGQDVTVSDRDREPKPGETKAATANHPDGRISDGDGFTVNRVEYRIQEIKNVTGRENDRDIYIVTSMGPFWERLGGKPLPQPYHGVRLKREASGAWAFHGPQKLAGAGLRLAALLNQAQAAYTAALETATKHIERR